MVPADLTRERLVLVKMHSSSRQTSFDIISHASRLVSPKFLGVSRHVGDSLHEDQKKQQHQQARSHTKHTYLHRTCSSHRERAKERTIVW
ncbi:hypothetical protein LX36DRAFT_180024 [Colletotrichum falcatum]|nr:hypothetical protein LX36DRAFT_180024 [Colletotrichum falcatum]